MSPQFGPKRRALVWCRTLYAPAGATGAWASVAANLRGAREPTHATSATWKVGVHRSVAAACRCRCARARTMASAALWAFMLVAAFALLFISRSVGGGSDKNGELLLLAAATRE